MQKNEDPDLDKIVDAKSLHARLGICTTGIDAFALDYGLDPRRQYAIRQLRETVQKVGFKPSLAAFRWELKKLHII